MLRKLSITVLLAISTTGCVSASLPEFDIGSVIDQHEALDERRVRLIGWVATCAGYSCQITEFAGQSGRSIRIGYAPQFDAAIARRHGDELRIELEATVNAGCFNHANDPPPGPRIVTVCTDRINQLRNAKLVRILERRDFEINEDDE